MTCTQTPGRHLLSITAILITLFFAMGAMSQKSYASPMTEPKEIQQLWTEYLEKSVVEKAHQSAVDYEKLLKAESVGIDELATVLDAMSQVTVATFEKWPEEEQIAFFINAYNAFTIRLILNYYPVKSILRIRPVLWPGGPWKYFDFSLLETEMSLDEIEHEILRKKYQEPRIHFALNCASRGCPPLMPEAFTGEKLESQLEAATKNFLQDRTFHFLEKSENKTSTLKISAIFDWFKKDFGDDQGLRSFLAQRADALKVPRSSLEGPNQTEIDFNHYNWCLNDTKGFTGKHGPNPGTVFLNCDHD